MGPSLKTEAGLAFSVERRGEAAAVLARQRMVGAELGEDRDHHPAQQVAPLGVVGLARPPPGGPRAPPRGRPRPRRRSSASSVPRAVGAVVAELGGQPGPRGQALGLEVAVKAVEQLERLVGLAAREQQPAQLAAAAALRGSSSSALRSDSSSPAAASLSAGEGTSRSRNCSICAGGIAPVNSATTLPSRNAFTAGMPRIPKLAASVWLRVGVHLGQLDLALALRDRRLERRAEHAAGAAPLGPEVDHHGDLARALDHARLRNRSR